jgi:predicted amidohydrolase YtcJ
VGKRADLVILNKDLMEVPAAEVLEVKPVATYASGVKVF